MIPTSYTHPSAHVERRDGHSDIIGRLSVHLAQLQPRVVLFLPRSQRLLSDPAGICEREAAGYK